MDSHGDNVSNESARESNECRGFACGAYELFSMPISAAIHLIYVADFAGEPPSMSVAESALECNCVVDAGNHKISFKKKLLYPIAVAAVFLLP